MTRFTVVWLKRATNQLARIWLDTEARAAVTHAAAQIDAALLNDPEDKGERLGVFRALTIYPLRVLYVVLEQDRIVRVARVRLLK